MGWLHAIRGRFHTGFVIEDYVIHMQHQLDDVLSRPFVTHAISGSCNRSPGSCLGRKKAYCNWISEALFVLDSSCSQM